MKVLIVEDETRLGRFLQCKLQEEKWEPTWAQSVHDARRLISTGHYDAIVLDLTLPDGDGLNLLREWRRAAIVVPVLILSARDTVQDRVQGLNLGADDYLPKPFSFDELTARLRSLVRRDVVGKDQVFEHRGIRMDLLGRTVTVQGNAIDLTGREFDLLELFLRNPRRVLTRSFISETIWEMPFDPETNLLDFFMSRLRSKLEPGSGRPVFKTIRGVGYELE